MSRRSFLRLSAALMGTLALGGGSPDGDQPPATRPPAPEATSSRATPTPAPTEFPTAVPTVESEPTKSMFATREQILGKNSLHLADLVANDNSNTPDAAVKKPLLFPDFQIPQYEVYSGTLSENQQSLNQNDTQKGAVYYLDGAPRNEFPRGDNISAQYALVESVDGKIVCMTIGFDNATFSGQNSTSPLANFSPDSVVITTEYAMLAADGKPLQQTIEIFKSDPYFSEWAQAGYPLFVVNSVEHQPTASASKKNIIGYFQQNAGVTLPTKVGIVLFETESEEHILFVASDNNQNTSQEKAGQQPPAAEATDAPEQQPTATQKPTFEPTPEPSTVAPTATPDTLPNSGTSSGRSSEKFPSTPKTPSTTPEGRSGTRPAAAGNVEPTPTATPVDKSDPKEEKWETIFEKVRKFLQPKKKSRR